MSSVTTPPEQHNSSESHLVRALVRWEDTHWSALFPDFTVVGQGATPDAAVKNACDALVLYLDDCAADGLTFEQSRRPISRRWRTELWAQTLFSRLARPRRRPEQRDVPVGAHFAAC